MGTKQTNVRLSEDARQMLDKLGERHSANHTDTITKAIHLMWFVTGGGKHLIDVDQLKELMRVSEESGR